MAAFYVDDEEVWKCLQHPSKRRRTGICPTCLRDRLAALCPDCGKARPCDCGSAAGAESVSSSSSFSIFGRSYSKSVAAASAAGIGAVDSVSNLIDNEPSMRRARSVAVPFLSRLSASVRGGRGVSSATASAPSTDIGSDANGEQNETAAVLPAKVRRKKSSIFSIFKRSKKGEKRKDDVNRTDGDDTANKENEDVYAKIRMMRSRSVAVPIYTASADAGEVTSSPSPAKSRRWHFPSPLGAFRQSTKSSQVVHERSPVYRG